MFSAVLTNNFDYGEHKFDHCQAQQNKKTVQKGPLEPVCRLKIRGGKQHQHHVHRQDANLVEHVDRKVKIIQKQSSKSYQYQYCHGIADNQKQKFIRRLPNGK